MDLLEIFDANNRPLDFTKPKKDAHRDGDWHRTSEIVVLNDQDEVLLSLRHPGKAVLPDYWDVCVGGHVDPQESYENCAIREVEEEIGVRPKTGELHFLGMVAVEAIDPAVSLIDREHAAVYLYRTNRTLDQFTMQFDEVADLRFIPLKTVLAELRSGNYSLAYTPPQSTYLQTLEMTADYLAQHP
ncbi:NUDIX hydrolase [Larkinella rosea]|uniref:NUDIX domain-containing protein n=1 Tax=Larkinella rosea TaxID=2025312 RepID=A0A3P1C2K8_9BACT|nr:NUDIX domain-containing protein [Larkinella rosea]RRB07293.1 NUDIX domain-containing protein [Larkinella rosea]